MTANTVATAGDTLTVIDAELALPNTVLSTVTMTLYVELEDSV
jgi:hypothetical protein